MAQRVTVEQLIRLARAAVAACGGEALVGVALDGRGGDPWVTGAGKAVGAMAAGARRALGARYRAGPLVGKHAGPSGIEVMVAGHPLPDEGSERATTELLAFFAARRSDEEILFLLSGGASALIGGALPGVSLAALRKATEVLLRSGASIAEMNVVRRHVGRALGGRLAAATRATVEVLALSDVIGDDPATIGSGPASADPSTFAEALRMARRASLGDEVTRLLERGARGELDETPKPGDPRLQRVTCRILATPATLRERAADEVRAAGLDAVLSPDLVDGDVATLAQRYRRWARHLSPGSVGVAVGEPTVRVLGGGSGGRAQQLCLEMARLLDGLPGAFLAIGSDGTDGPTDAAGAAVDGSTWARARAAGLAPEAALAGFDAFRLFDRLGGLIRTGATGTNLLDLHLLAAG